ADATGAEVGMTLPAGDVPIEIIMVRCMMPFYEGGVFGRGLRDMAVMISAKSHWQSWGELDKTLKTGRSGPQHAFGTDIFSWFQMDENRAEWDIFNKAMTSFSSGISHLVAAGYDFSGFKHLVDIGGGHGQMLKTILENIPDTKGTLFDLPAVVEGATDVGERITCEGGDFFEGVTAGGDCYILKHIIHDWSDEQSIKILSNIANSMADGGKVLLVESVMPDSPEPHPAKFMDMNMLAMTEGGCERTETEYAALFEKAGLKLQAIHPTPSPMSIIEAVKA
ncbi:MAG: methyltransferase domain-containing protein, partial [Planctomycetes bacterium]|nr:methyltransferase domain-containing protein [Planctomycetota bacterium]